MGEQLLTCPFCGGPAELTFGRLSQENYAACLDDDGCRTCGPSAADRDSAIAAWNRRAGAQGDSLSEASYHLISLRQYLEEAGHPAGGDALSKLALVDQAIASAQGDRRDAGRYRWSIENARWIRHEHEAYVAIPVARDADLSCVAMRKAAIDAAMAEQANSPAATTQDPAG